jgi:hypothetical protein
MTACRSLRSSIKNSYTTYQCLPLFLSVDRFFWINTVHLSQLCTYDQSKPPPPPSALALNNCEWICSLYAFYPFRQESQLKKVQVSRSLFLSLQQNRGRRLLLSKKLSDAHLWLPQRGAQHTNAYFWGSSMIFHGPCDLKTRPHSWRFFKA